VDVQRGSDLLAIRSYIRFLIEDIVTLLVPMGLVILLQWWRIETSHPWLVVISVLCAWRFVRFSVGTLPMLRGYSAQIFVSLLLRSMGLFGLLALAFQLEGQLSEHWQRVFAFTFLTGWSNAVLTYALVKLAMLPRMRRKPLRLVVVAVTEASAAFVDQLAHQPFLAVEFVGYIEDRPQHRLPVAINGPVLSRIDEMRDTVNHLKVDHILASLPTQANYRFGLVLEQALDTTASVHYLHDFIMFKPIREGMTAFGTQSVFTIIDAPMSGITPVLKRLFDIVASGLALLTLLPLFTVVAAWIKLDSKGPVFFSQNRWGVGAEPFKIYKFRSMTQETSLAASDGTTVTQTTKGDMRVTRVGAFIRRTSIDELPQLLNILKGDMSIIGPRPHAISHNESYRGLVKGYMIRHKIKPGLSGWAQIHGFRGETETLDKMEGRIRYDLDYLRNFSFSLDIYIIYKTVMLVISGKNAY
jgi:putative colanic acid biosysnthesis UDP-glucose lipid carrier transferase